MALDLGAIKAMLMDPKGLRPQPARAALEQIVARVEELEAERDALAAENKRLKEAADRHRREFRWMDMTPDAGLPERILSGYLDNSEWTDNALGMEPSNPCIVQMNQDRHERNTLIERALAALSLQPPTAPAPDTKGVSGDSAVVEPAEALLAWVDAHRDEWDDWEDEDLGLLDGIRRDLRAALAEQVRVLREALERVYSRHVPTATDHDEDVQRVVDAALSETKKETKKEAKP